MNLKEIGIEIGFLVSGLFGAILMVSKDSAKSFKGAILSILGGMASANYLTPVMVEIANLKETKIQNGLAFVTGFLGLKLVEIVSDKLLKKIEQPKEEFVKNIAVKKKVNKK